MNALAYPYIDGRAAERPSRRSRWIIRIVSAIILEILRQMFGEMLR